MPRMMRMTSALLFVGAMFVACSWGEGSGDDGPSGGGGVDAAVSSAVCGDSVCAASEIGFCAPDCGNGGGNTTPTCGNNTCETGETSTSCPNDCAGGGSGSGSGSSAACPSDPIECIGCIIGGPCPTGHDATSCQACALGGGGGLGNCTGGMPDGMCDASEDPTSCPLDCM